jgi:hypothetical protein
MGNGYRVADNTIVETDDCATTCDLARSSLFRKGGRIMSERKVVGPNSQLCFVLAISAILVFLGASQRTEGVTIAVDPVQGAGFVDVDLGPGPLILGAPVGTPLEVDFVFNDMKHIELFEGASTDIEFGIGNAGNNVDLPYRIVFDLSNEHGNLITEDALVVEGVAPKGLIHIASQDLSPLPPTILHDFHVRVETDGVGGLFDLFVAGGAGDFGTVVSGPVTFNRAEVGDWIIPEPSSITLLCFGILSLLAYGWRRRRV